MPGHCLPLGGFFLFCLFLSLGTQGGGSSHSCWLMGVFSWDGDCRWQGLSYLGQTGGVSTGFSGSRPRGNTWQGAFSLRLWGEAVWTEAISQGLLGEEEAPGLCLSHLMTQWQYCTTLSPDPVPVPRRGSILYSLLSGSCAHNTYHSHLRRALQEEAEAWA